MRGGTLLCERREDRYAVDVHDRLDAVPRAAEQTGPVDLLVVAGDITTGRHARRRRAGGRKLAIPRTAHGPSGHVGDLIVIDANRLGERRRVGEILEVLGTAEYEHYRVRWDDGRETILTSGSDPIIRQVQHPADVPVLVHEP